MKRRSLFFTLMAPTEELLLIRRGLLLQACLSVEQILTFLFPFTSASNISQCETCRVSEKLQSTLLVLGSSIEC